jgi:Leucine-rich repeat (LRR) protein
LFYNLLSGILPSEFNKLTKLRSLKINNNNLSGLPSLTLPALDTLNIQNNRLTFEDIEPNFTLAKGEFLYSPQDSTGINQTVYQRLNKSYTFLIACGGKNNAYQWYKENAKILQATDSIFVIPAIKQSDAGSYTCSVTNSVVTGLVINSRPIILEVTPDGRTTDSLALVTLYNTTGGTTWTNSTNWLSSSPISTWYGVTVGSNEGSKGLADTTSVIRLNLSGNNLKGSIPREIGKMTALQTLDLSNNNLEGPVPQEINSITSLQTLDLSMNNLNNLPLLTLANLDTLLINNNQFSFNDIEPNLNKPEIGIKYSSQDSIGMKKDTLCLTGTSIKFTVPDSASHNYYMWLKDNIPLPNSASHIYRLTNLQLSDSGIYTCKITNSLVTGLTINARPVKLHMAQATGIENISDLKVKVYPNPSDGIIRLEFRNRLTTGARMEVYNYYGIIVFNRNLESTKFQELDLTQLPAGIYLLKVYDNNLIYNQKIVLH